MTQRILQRGEIESLDRIHIPRVRLPQPSTLFQDRSQRLAQLAEGHAMADFLRFNARLASLQHRCVQAVPPAARPSDDTLAEAAARGLPPLPPGDGLPPGWRARLAVLLADLANDAALPDGLRQAVRHLSDAAPAALDALARQALSSSLPADLIATGPLLVAALQAEWSLRAAALSADDLPTGLATPTCPVCGSPPVASILRIGGETAGLRYLHCGLCETEWHMVRVSCSHCTSTKGIHYQGVENAAGELQRAVLAETCDQCQTYAKIVSQEVDPLVDPVADDLATLALDVLMADTPFRRASAPPLLAMAGDEGDEGNAG